MKLSYTAPLVALLAAGCASTSAPPLPMPSLLAPRIAINKPPPRPIVPVLATATEAKPQLVVAAPPPPAAAPAWLVQQSDLTVSVMLARWAKDAGWSISWAADAPQIAITGDGRVDKPDFLSAADLVITDAKAKGYAIKAKAFADNVLEIKKVDQ